MSKPVRVLIVDDSAIVRRVLSECLGSEPDIEVVGTAPDPLIARSKIETLSPDVLTLDIEMPRMDGLTFLKQLMRERPMPVIVVSSVAGRGCVAALDAIANGAVEVLGKPNGPYSVGDLKLTLAQKIRAAARATLTFQHPDTPRPRPNLERAGASAARPLGSAQLPATPLIAIGASTGGTEAIRAVLEVLPAETPPILIVQHIPPGFSRAFADRLDSICSFRVREATDGDKVEPGLALVAPGDLHMMLRRRPAGGFIVEVSTGPRVCYQRPAVDVLFQSVADAAGSDSVGVLLTGMGSDGAHGLLEMRTAGCRTIAQDEATSVVYGMPREAARLGAVEQVLPLGEIAAHLCALIEHSSGMPRRTTAAHGIPQRPQAR